VRFWRAPTRGPVPHRGPRGGAAATVVDGDTGGDGRAAATRHGGAPDTSAHSRADGGPLREPPRRRAAARGMAAAAQLKCEPQLSVHGSLMRCDPRRGCVREPKTGRRSSGKQDRHCFRLPVHPSAALLFRIRDVVRWTTSRHGEDNEVNEWVR